MELVLIKKGINLDRLKIKSHPDILRSRVEIIISTTKTKCATEALDQYLEAK